LAVLRRCRQTDYRELGAAARPNFMAAAGKTGAFRATGPTCRSGGRRERSTSATGSSGSDRTGRRRTDRRRPISRIDAVASVDGARSRERGARDRADQGQHRADQGQPATNAPRCCQAFRAEPAAQDISASAAVGRRPLHTFKLTETREITPCLGCIRMRSGEALFCHTRDSAIGASEAPWL
jgi:hypothetical protein